MSDGGFSPMGIPPGSNDFGDRRDDTSPWYTRWYVWVLPIIVVIGALVTIFGGK